MPLPRRGECHARSLAIPPPAGAEAALSSYAASWTLDRETVGGDFAFQRFRTQLSQIDRWHPRSSKLTVVSALPVGRRPPTVTCKA